MLAIVGIVLVSVPFFKSLSVSEKSKNDAWGSCDVTTLAEGEMKQCGWARVYRRTKLDITAIDKFTYLLEDPNSELSRQPEDAKNKWRSVKKEYFIFWPAAPIRGCEVRLQPAGAMAHMELPEKDATDTSISFFDYCEGRTWDISGRLYRREGNPVERNLIVPNVRWTSKNNVLILSR